MAFDEEGFLRAMRVYINQNYTQVTGEDQVGIYIVASLDPLSMQNLTPPFICFKDGECENVSHDECDIEYTMEFMGVVQTRAERDEPLMGYAQGTTGLYGILHIFEELQDLLSYSNIQAGISIGNSQLRQCYWASMSPSVRVTEGGKNWQSKILEATIHLRVTT